MPAARRPVRSPAEAEALRHALALSCLLGRIRTSGVRAEVKAAAEAAIGGAVGFLMRDHETPEAEGGPVREGGDSGTRLADPAPGPPPASPGPEAATSGPERPDEPDGDAEGARLPHWVGN
jgi:hypothetical protein